MRNRVNIERVEQFMNALAQGAKSAASVYLVGGASAVLFSWRESTVDIDFKMIPEPDELLRRLPAIKESLQINVELASPDDFIPSLPSWQDRSRFIRRIGKVDFFHYDFYGQALAKIERGHRADKADVKEMIAGGLVEREVLLKLFLQIEDQLYKYPAVNPRSFRERVEQIANATEESATSRSPNSE